MANVLILQNPLINTDDLKVEVLDATDNEVVHQSFLVGAGNQITGHLHEGIVLRISVSAKTVPADQPANTAILGIDGHLLDRNLGGGILVPQ